MHLRREILISVAGLVQNIEQKIERSLVSAGEGKRKEELLGYSATDDNFDEIGDNVDTFRP